jgi:hypothetical protein
MIIEPITGWTVVSNYRQVLAQKSAICETGPYMAILQPKKVVYGKLE